MTPEARVVRWVESIGASTSPNPNVAPFMIDKTQLIADVTALVAVAERLSGFVLAARAALARLGGAA